MFGSIGARGKQLIKKTAVSLYRMVVHWDGETRSRYDSGRQLDLEGGLTPAKKEQLNGENFARAHGYPIHWKDPRSFNEKIMWGILHYQNPLRIRCNDKFSVKGYVEQMLGPGYTADVYGWWTDPDDIAFETLPKRFVLKVNWGGGYNIYVPDRDKIDAAGIREQLRTWMKPGYNLYYRSFRWDAKYDVPFIYAEEYLPPAKGAGRPHDYKMNCYHGVCRDLFVSTITAKTYYMDWFDRDFNPLPMTTCQRKHAPGGVEKPRQFDRMLAVAEKLSKPFPFMRIDLYVDGDRILVGEMTFAYGSGYSSVQPVAMDYKRGEYMDMPEFLDFDRLLESDPLPAQEAYLLEEKLTPDMTRRYLERRAFTALFYYPRLDIPRTMNEKMLWTALHWKDPRLSVLADRYETKRYIAQTVGERYVVPDIGVYTDVDQIEWDALPEQFAAKSTANFGGDHLYLVRHKSCDHEGVFKATIGDWLLPWNTFYYQNACLPGRKAEPRVMIERLIAGGTRRLDEYRFYCCEGRVQLVCAACERATERESRTFLDAESWQALPVRASGLHKRPAAPRPKKLGEMLDLCGQLSQGFPFVRIDFLAAEERVYVNGMSCDRDLFQRLEPVEWDWKLGERFSVPEARLEEI